MSWRDRTAQILGNAPPPELKELKKVPAEVKTTLYSVLSVRPPALSGDAVVTALVNQVADANAFSDVDRAEALELALRNPGPWLGLVEVEV